MPITDLYLEPSGKKNRDRVLSYHIDFDQRIDNRTGKPVGRPVLTQMSVKINRDSEPSEPFYIEWQLEPTKQVDLDISFYDNHQLKRSIKISRAYLVSYNQTCTQAGNVEEILILSPDEVDIDGVPFKRKDAA